MKLHGVGTQSTRYRQAVQTWNRYKSGSTYSAARKENKYYDLSYSANCIRTYIYGYSILLFIKPVHVLMLYDEGCFIRQCIYISQYIACPSFRLPQHNPPVSRPLLLKLTPIPRVRHLAPLRLQLARQTTEHTFKSSNVILKHQTSFVE